MDDDTPQPPSLRRLTPWALLAITLIGLGLIYLQALALGMSSASPGRTARLMRDFEEPILALVFLAFLWNGGLALRSFFRPLPRWASRLGLVLAVGPPLLYLLLSVFGSLL